MRTIRTNGLPVSPADRKTYSFILDDGNSPPVVHIPGEQRGPHICYEPARFRVTLAVSRGNAKTVVRAVGYAGC